ncbi:glycosyltransferase [uncultured Clostridium sp.]|uniref:glycosyltransferase n=1 Tax=uncultured Clostridium sp. TaxID=59620 RepID=UPI00259843B7|nr:glycosyltransferase [uncultured Clostridium sp.]
MKNDIVLSIIVPVYNVEKYLDECLESIIKNYDQKIEVILVDDGSKDNSSVLCDEYAKEYNFITVIHKENGGLSSARNAGIDKAKGKYIWFVDSDDYISDSSISNILDAARKSTDLIIGNYSVFYPNGNREVYQDFKFDIKENMKPYEYFYQLGNVSYAAVRFIIRREIIHKYDLRFMEGIYHEDEQWTPRVLCTSETFSVIKPTIYNYRLGNSNSIMGMVNPKKSYDKIIICNSLYNISKKSDFSKNMIEYLNSRILHNYIAILNEYSKYSKEERKKLFKILKENLYLIDDYNSKKATVIKWAIKFFGIPITSKLLSIRNKISR